MNFFQYFTTALHGVCWFSDTGKGNLSALKGWSKTVHAINRKHENGLQGKKEIDVSVEGAVRITNWQSQIFKVNRSRKTASEIETFTFDDYPYPFKA